MEAGARLGHYELVEQIGEGGMGVVWRALDERLGRDVAVKVLPDELAQDPERLARFEREAQAVAALNHPNIVTIHSVEEHDGLRFITMELVKGRSLRALIPPGGVTTHELIERALPLLDALAQAHAQGITHRDLKPDNVMVDDDGRLKILDFGLAKTAAPPPEDEADAETLMTTGAGTVVGTPHYMSPEQAKGQAVDERSDLFSVGVMLHEMATGKRPFEGDSAVEVLSSILRDPAPEVGELQPAHPKQLSRIVRSCLEKEPDRRCQTARSLGAQLESLRDELSATGSRGGGLRWAAVALIVVLAGLFVAQVAQRPGESAEAAPPAAEESEPRRASLAVLPFVNVTGGEENEYFSDGITDELINALGRVEGLRIPARTTVFTLKGQSLTVGEVGDRLGVEHVLEGTVRKAGDRIRISVQLVNAGDGFEVWSGSFERDYGDVFALQEEIARSLVSSLQVRLVGDGDVRLLGSMTTNLEAYDLYLRAIYELYRGVEPGLRNAVELFGQAIEKDPGHARSWVGLARAHYLLANTYDRPRDRIPLARQAVEEALQLDPNLAEAHAVLGAIHLEFDWDWSAARQRADRAIELDPYDANGRQLLGWVLISQGEFEQGVAEVQRAEELDPFSTQRLFCGHRLLHGFALRGSCAHGRVGRAAERRGSEGLPHAGAVTAVPG
jgi:TolB-like protein